MESLEKHIQALFKIIEKEFEHYKRFYEMVKQEQNILVNADIESLEANLREQQVLTGSINKLEAKRIQELEVISIYLGAAPETMKIALIAKNAKEDLSRSLTELERRFKSVIQEILKINKSNKFLIHRSLQFIDKNIQVFFGALEDKGVYSSNASNANAYTKKNCLVDRKA